MHGEWGIKPRTMQVARISSGLSTAKLARAVLAVTLMTTSAALFLAGLLSNEKDGDDVADTGPRVVASEGGESKEWGGVHDAHGASADQSATTMNCAVFQGDAQ